MGNKYQSITVEFSNGKVGTFVGQVILSKEELTSGLKLLGIVVSEPQDLPAGCNFIDVQQLKDEGTNDKPNQSQ